MFGVLLQQLVNTETVLGNTDPSNSFRSQTAFVVTALPETAWDTETHDLPKDSTAAPSNCGGLAFAHF